MVILDVLNECRELVHAETAVLNRISLEIMSESAASALLACTLLGCPLSRANRACRAVHS